MTYEFLQSYWWFLISLLGALLVFLMFVQGANTLIFCLGKTPEERRLIIENGSLPSPRSLLSEEPSSLPSHSSIARVLAEPIGFG